MPLPATLNPTISELLECDGSGGKFTDADWDRIVAGRAVADRLVSPIISPVDVGYPSHLRGSAATHPSPVSQSAGNATQKTGSSLSSSTPPHMCNRASRLALPTLGAISVYRANVSA